MPQKEAHGAFPTTLQECHYPQSTLAERPRKGAVNRRYLLVMRQL